MGKEVRSPRLFSGISWGVTILIVIALLGFGLWHIFPFSVSAAAPQVAPTAEKSPTAPVLLSPTAAVDDFQALVRHVWLKTDINSTTTYTISQYTVQPGDALFSIAKQLNLTGNPVLGQQRYSKR